MARKRPPQHRADTPGIFIPKTDSSFDRDRYDRELAKMKLEGLDINLHPIERYYGGKTRYDLDAVDELFGQPVCARNYFDGSKDPERWTLRRLDWAQWNSCYALIHDKQFIAGQLLACRVGVAGVENSPLKLSGAASGMLSHEDMQGLHEADSGLITSLGWAVWQYSRELSESEKKA